MSSGTPPPRRGGWRWLRWLVPPLMVAVVLLVARLLPAAPGAEPTPPPSYSDFKEAVRTGRVVEAEVSSTTVHAKLRGPEGEMDVVRIEDPGLLAELEAAHVRAVGVDESQGWVSSVLLSLLPMALLVAFFVWMGRRARGAGGLASVGQSKPKLFAETDVKVGFDDVAGVDEAKEELREVISFLRERERFERLGGRIPKGILLVGPPGTGKTLLARAVAGEAGTPFFSISGSEFVEMFVGVGAARVRDLFAQAREKAPCIVFIDELDALGKVRNVGPMAHEEREQTLNQLLVEMDGFDPRTGVILMAATNRPEILDPALLRSGRFDRHVLVDRPDMNGRLAILRVHARKVRLGPDADLAKIAQMTPGLVGADLANVVNEAALLGVRRGKDAIGLADLEEAVERIVTGLEKRNRVLNPRERERVAHHEVGHALVALALPGSDPVQKISIIPRGIAALGYTLQRPTEDRFLMTQSELRDKIAILLGGRAAEQLIYGEPSTGAQDDLRKATEIARTMVRAYGMSGALGPVSFEAERRSLWIDAGSSGRGEHGEEVQRQIDAEVRRVLEEQQARATEILTPRVSILRTAARELIEKETLTGDDLGRLAAAPTSELAAAFRGL